MMMKKNRTLSLTLAALALAALTACGSLPASADISAAEAERLVSEHLGRSDLQILERSYDDGKYEIEFLLDGVKYEYEVNAATGRIQEIDRDDRYDDDRYEDDRDDRYDDDRYEDDRDGQYDDDRYEDDWDDQYDDDRYEDDRDDQYDDDRYEDD